MELYVAYYQYTEKSREIETIGIFTRAEDAYRAIFTKMVNEGTFLRENFIVNLHPAADRVKKMTDKQFVDFLCKLRHEFDNFETMCEYWANRYFVEFGQAGVNAHILQ
jgi:hypothetical protein